MLLFLLTAAAWSHTKGIQRSSFLETSLSHTPSHAGDVTEFDSVVSLSVENAAGLHHRSDTVYNRRVTRPLLSVVALQMGCHTFLLGGVNKHNTGEGGFAIILMLECIFVCGFGFFVAIIFGLPHSSIAAAA